MRTECQINASRTNGAKSRGPITTEGKRASSQNAVTHGMLSGTVVLDCESEDRFHELLASLFEEFQPETDFEQSLIENMATTRWRQMRVWGMEKAMMDHQIRERDRQSDSDEDNATRAARAFRALSDDSRSLDLINRYETRYDRQFYRAHRRFLEVRDRRTPPPARTESTSNRPSPVSIDSSERDSAKQTQQAVANSKSQSAATEPFEKTEPCEKDNHSDASPALDRVAPAPHGSGVNTFVGSIMTEVEAVADAAAQSAEDPQAREQTQ